MTVAVHSDATSDQYRNRQGAGRNFPVYDSLSMAKVNLAARWLAATGKSVGVLISDLK